MIQTDDYQLFEELRHRIQWIDEAEKLLALRKVKVEVIMHTLQRFKEENINCDIHKPVVHLPMTYERIYDTDVAMMIYKAKMDDIAKRIESRVQSDSTAAKVRREAYKLAQEVRFNNVQPQAVRFNNLQPQQPDTFPKELDTPLARYVFHRFVEAGVMSEDGEFYKWEGTPLEYGIFVAVGSTLLGLKEYEGGLNVWKPFNIAFQRTEIEVNTARSKYSSEYPKADNFDVLAMRRSDKGWRISYFFKQYVEEWKNSHNK